MKRLMGVFGTVLVIYIGLVTGLWALQRSLLYVPDRSAPDPAQSGVPEMAIVRFATSDGLTLAAWYRAAQAGQATIVYFHGNGGNIGDRGVRMRPFLNVGFGLLLVEYRGYGGNPGSPSEQGLYRDARAALAFLVQSGVPPQRLVVYGESLGSAVAVPIAAEQAAQGRPVAAVILEAPVSSVVDVAAYHYPWVPVRLLMKDRFEAMGQVPRVAAPVLVVHGEDDRVVPLRYGQALYAAAAEPKEAVWLHAAGHENLAQFGLQQIVLDFLDRRLPTAPNEMP
jgi:fermentation-respiration switch protein FrsA (DUF1100 family)